MRDALATTIATALGVLLAFGAIVLLAVWARGGAPALAAGKDGKDGKEGGAGGSVEE